MCLILFALDEHPDYPLVLAANRDEFLARPTAPAGPWRDHPDILGGRDLTAGGTWLAVSRRGRLAAVTNVREPGRFRSDARSRGELVTGLLDVSQPAQSYLGAVDGALYNGYNLLAYDGQELLYGSNRSEDGHRVVTSGVHGLSNASLDTPWPKVVSGRSDLAGALRQLSGDSPDPEPFFAILADRDQAGDAELPETGVGLDLERRLSSRFIVSEGYGTRSSTVVLIHRDGTCHLWERTFPSRGGSAEDRQFRIPFPLRIPV